MKKAILISLSGLLAIFVVLQCFRPTVDNPPVTGDFQAPVNVKAILVRACYDCHSNQTNLRWYDQVQPIYWQVAQHVKDGRKVLNFSDWAKLAPADQKGKLWEAINQIDQGAMPISSYTFVHRDARVSADDLSTLKNYLLSMVHDMPGDTGKLHDLDRQLHAAPATQHQPATALNGVSYIPDYKDWQIISTSERFDNGTMRIIYGNDIAVKAVKEHHINPWPDGATFAKVAWDKLEDKKGNITTGAFKQVEFMIKDAEKYRATKGWGFARFKTQKIVPYGKTAMFTTECINCHKPMKDNDYVFTFPIQN